MASKKKNGGGDLSTRILIEIRDEIRTLNGEVRELNGRVDRLETRQSEDSIRLGTELLAVARTMTEVRDLLKEQRLERERIENHERRISAIEKKIA